MVNIATHPNRSVFAGDEGLLKEHLERLEGNRAGAFAVHIRLSELRSSNRKPHFIRIASRSFESLENNYDAILFKMINQDLILSCRDVPINNLDEAIHKVRALFSQDPLAVGEEGSFDDRFASWYDLAWEEDFNNFKKVVTDMEVKAGRVAKEAEKARKAAKANKSMAGEPLDLGNLAKINHSLQNARVADLVCQQPVICIGAGKGGAVAFREYFVSMSDLQRRIAPDVNLLSSPWLFHYLAEILDKRMLVVVARHDFSEPADSISLNLNISTVRSREFQHFHRSIKDHVGKLIVEFQLTDVFVDVDAYYFARDMLQKQGYRVLIDGLTPLTIQFFDPGILEADFVKINWSPEFSGEEVQERMMGIQAMVRSSKQRKVILGRVDSESAIKSGLAMGVQHFQGYFVDTLTQAMVSKGIV